MSCMKAMKCAAATVIVIINLISIILSILFSVLGGLILWGAPLLQKIPGISGMISSSGGSISKEISISKDTIDTVVGYLSGAGTAFFVLGIILLVVSLIGCCGAVCSNKSLLITYIVCIGLVFVAMVVIAALLTTNRLIFFKEIEKQVGKAIKNEFTGSSKPNTFTTALSFVQMYLSCCGLVNGSDFDSATKWERNYTIPSEGESVVLQYPISCCKTKEFVPVDYECATDPNESNSNYKKGCITEFDHFIAPQMSRVIGGLWGVVAAVGVIIAAAIIILVAIRRERDETKDNEIA